jgi:pimeloyl-[acyl-carrier protein] methyl ester esterase
MPTQDPEVATLHREDAGAGAPIVLVHGWSLSSAAFGDEIAFLARGGRRAIAPDLRGHGRSPAPGSAFGLADLARDVAALFDALAHEGAVLLGWSLGAEVALAAAPLLRGRVAALVLVSGTPRFTEGEGWPHGLPARSVDGLALRVRRDAPKTVARFFDGMFVEGELDATGRARADAVRAAVRPADPGALLSALDVLAREDLRAGLPALDLPVLLVHGDRDPVCPPGASRAMAAAIPRARLVEVAGAGHAPFLSRPGPFRDALASFLGALP